MLADDGLGDIEMICRMVRRLGCVVFALSVLQANLALAAEQTVTSYLVAPEDEKGAQFKRDVAFSRVKTDVGYIDETSDGLLSVPKNDIDVEAPPARLDFNLIWALAIIVVLVGLFLKFGSSGNLFSRDRSKTEQRRNAAEGWGLVAEDLSPSRLLEQIRATVDRREALIVLLRHSLLSAADATGVWFARVDTEREAFRRLPTEWPHISELDFLLRETELAHYGGRSIQDDAFRQCLSAGEKILAGGRPV